MAVTIDSSWGAAAANAYASLSEAASYLETKVKDVTAFTQATTVRQGAALIESTRNIDSAYVWRGQRFYYNQYLEFPRTLESYPYNYVQLTAELETLEFQRQHDNVREACIEQAVWLLQNAGKNEHAERQAMGIASYSESIGPFSDSASYVSKASKLCLDAQQRLADWMGYPKLVRK